MGELRRRSKRHIRLDCWRAVLTVEDVRDAGAPIVIQPICVDIWPSIIISTFLIADCEELISRSLAKWVLLARFTDIDLRVFHFLV